MLLLGIDVGTSSIKVSVVNAETQTSVASAQFPESESAIISPKPGWAEQSPDTWWSDVQQAILKAHRSKKYNPADIVAIGIRSGYTCRYTHSVDTVPGVYGDLSNQTALYIKHSCDFGVCTIGECTIHRANALGKLQSRKR